MRKQDTFNTIDDATEQQISVTDLVSTIWHARWIILIATLLMGASSLSWALLHASYKSQGFFQFGGPIPMLKEKNIKYKENNYKENSYKENGISLADYKRYAASYGSIERFGNFIRDKKLESAPGVKDLFQIFGSRNGISRLIDPIFPFTKLDAKELMEQPKDSVNNVIGLSINYETNSPEIAKKMVNLLGHYAMDSIIYSIYSDDLRFKQDETRNKIAKFDNLIISNKVLLEEYRQKINDLKQIIARNPAAAKESTRQVITVSEDTARYLPPITQLMTTEVQTSEANQVILKAKREQTQQILLLEYYDNAIEMLNSTKSGEAVLRGLEPLKENIFKNKNLQDDVVKEVYNTVTNDNLTALNLYLDRSRFIAGPTLPMQSTARPIFKLGIGLMLGFLLSILFVFGRKWWQENQSQFSH